MNEHVKYEIDMMKIFTLAPGDPYQSDKKLDKDMNNIYEKINDITLAYAAGFLDGEGCFSCYKDSKICIACSNTNRKIIEWFHKTFGGSLSVMKKKKKHHRDTYSWQVVSNDALRVAQMVVPFLQQKAEEALILIAIKQLVYSPGKAAPEKIILERKRLNNLLKELKHVTWE